MTKSFAAERAETITAMSSWLFCSVGMTIFNKMAIETFPCECTLVAVQMLFTVAAMLIFCWSSLHIGSFWDFLRWSRVAPFFSGVLLTSILALKEAPVTLVVVFRSLAPLFSLVIEQFYPSPLEVNRQMLASLFLLLVGTALYCTDMPFDSSNMHAIGWVFANNAFVVADRMLQRLMLAKDQLPVDISKPSVTLLNNLLGVVPLLIVAMLTKESSEVGAALAQVNTSGYIVILCTCVAGVGIAYTGIWTQSLISATSFLVLATGSKFFVIFIDLFILRTKVLTPLQILGASITISASVAYGQIRSNIELSEREKEQLLPKKEVA
eukprot:TRINITY_DN45984_c0_g1_i1.p1 TRINITY_DN45984_c0_g1~~TRINITY_DN45984_c0_g1_i1.p1  ORF type:complete len:345 (+),score=63.04 TRINITY_DN45984_c0_g1_i1:65-1036(+)